MIVRSLFGAVLLSVALIAGHASAQAAGFDKTLATMSQNPGTTKVAFRGRGFRAGGFRAGRGMRPGAWGHGTRWAAGGGRWRGRGGWHAGGGRWYGGRWIPYGAGAVAAGVATGAVVGTAVAASNASNAASYCASRYRSYDPGSGTFLGNDGLRHPCP
jgi:hypothetical protein